MSAQPEHCPFQPELDQRYPIGSLRLDPDSIRLITTGRISPFRWVSIFRNSPARNTEAEILIGRVLTEAVRAGQWIDIPALEADETTEPTTFTLPTGGRLTIGPITYQYRRATDILCGIGFTQRMVDGAGRHYLRPTEQLVEFIDQSVGFGQSPQIK